MGGLPSNRSHSEARPGHLQWRAVYLGHQAVPKGTLLGAVIEGLHNDGLMAR